MGRACAMRGPRGVTSGPPSQPRPRRAPEVLPSAPGRGPLAYMVQASIIDSRAAQMFPTLTPAEIERMRRFGAPRSYAPDEALVEVGQTGHGMTVILSGEVRITSRDDRGEPHLIVAHRAGAFMGELAQLSGRPSLVDAHAVGPVEALIIPPERLRALLVAEAELGEKIMRPLILPPLRLPHTGPGPPAILGPAGHGDVLRLAR